MRPEDQPPRVGPRAVVVGAPCAGKSTLAQSLATKLGAPHVELDALHWEPGWHPAERTAFRSRVEAATRGSRWVVDGNYRETHDIVWPRATDVVWLDASLPTVLWRVLRRSWRRWRSRQLLWETNRDSFWKHLRPTDESLLWWALTTHRRRRREYARAASGATYPHLRWTRLRSGKDIARWLKSVEPDEASVT